MKKIIYILLISPMFWAVLCHKCDETVAKFQFKPQDYEWQIYDLNQTYTFKSTKTGEVKTYSIVKAEKMTLKSNNGKDKWGCLVYPKEQDIITMEMVNSTQERIVIRFQAFSNTTTTESNTSLSITFYDSSNSFLRQVGYPIGYIHQNQSLFINAQPLSSDSNSPYHSIIFYNQLKMNGFTYQDVFKINDSYYSKTWGIIQFTVNDETWQRI